MRRGRRAIPAATALQRRSRASASRAWARPAGKSARVTDASQPPASRAPALAAASSETATTRSFSSAVIASNRAISVTAAAFSTGLRNTGCASRTETTASWATAIAPRIGCGAGIS